MSKLATVAQNLVNILKDVPDFGGRVGMTLGGTEADPTLSNLETPYAWAVLTSSQAQGQDRERWEKVRWNFTVIMGLDYGEGENDFIDKQLSLVESVCQAVAGTQVNAPGPVRWSFDGLSLIDGEPSKLKYSLNFSIVTFYTQST